MQEHPLYCLDLEQQQLILTYCQVLLALLQLFILEQIQVSSAAFLQQIIQPVADLVLHLTDIVLRLLRLTTDLQTPVKPLQPQGPLPMLEWEAALQ